MKRRIFLFLIGDKSKLSKTIATLEKQNFEVILGPTLEDEKELMQIPFYKNSHDQKIWSFCSDVWRVWKLSTNVGLYMDVSSIVGEKVGEFYDRIIKNDTWLFKETAGYIGSAVCASGISNNDFYSQIFSFFKKFDSRFVRLYPIAPTLFTYQARKSLNINDWEENSSKGFHISTLEDVRNINTIKKCGGRSWGQYNTLQAVSWIDTFENDDAWKTMSDLWINKDSNTAHKGYFEILHFMEQVEKPEKWLLIKNLRNLYDASDQKDRRELSSIYKSIKSNKKLKLNERLIWSKFYIFFTLKFLK